MSQLKSRKPLRLPNYDYSSAGYYFITICVKDGHELLGKIAGGGDLDAPRIELSEIGEIVEKYILLTNERHGHIKIDKFVIMPNHINLISVVLGGTSRSPSPTSARIPMFVSMLKKFVNKDCGFSIWQRGYHDHIIRNEQEYKQIWKYIDENPQKWESDEYFNRNNGEM